MLVYWLCYLAFCRVGHRILFRLVRSILFHTVLFSSFWRLMRPKRTFGSFPFFSVLFRSFLKDGKECKKCNVLLQRTEKNAKIATFFCKEHKRTQERVVLLQKNARTFRYFFNIFIDIYRYIYIYINIC